jgi:hypothetical protein
MAMAMAMATARGPGSAQAQGWGMVLALDWVRAQAPAGRMAQSEAAYCPYSAQERVLVLAWD